MTNVFVLEELLCVYPFSNFEVMSRGGAKGVSFTRVCEDMHTIQGGELLLLNLNTLQESLSTTITKAIEAKVSTIFLIGKRDKKPLLSESVIKGNHVPILFYKDDFSLDQINNILPLIDQLKKLNQFSSFVKNSTYHIVQEVNDVGIDEFLSRLEAKIGQKIMITDRYFKELFRSEERNSIPISLAATLENQYIKEKPETDFSDFLHIHVKDTSNSYSIRPLFFNHMHVGYIIIEGEPVSTFASLQVESIVPVLMAELKKHNEFLQYEKKYQKNFIYDLLHNNFDSQYTIINQARNWGWDLSVPHLLLLMELKSDKEFVGEPEWETNIEKVIKNTLSALFYHSIIVELDGLFIILIAVDQPKQRKEMKNESKRIAAAISKKMVEHMNEDQALLGIGKFYPSIIDICRSYQEAKMALEFGRFKSDDSTIIHFEDLGIIRLLANIRQELLEEFSYEYLGELAEYDAENEADMLSTIQVYLTENGNLKSTADKLFIHINTLRNRLKKIENILNIDLQNSDDFLNLLISLKIRNMNSR